MRKAYFIIPLLIVAAVLLPSLAIINHFTEKDDRKLNTGKPISAGEWIYKRDVRISVSQESVNIRTAKLRFSPIRVRTQKMIVRKYEYLYKGFQTGQIQIQQNIFDSGKSPKTKEIFLAVENGQALLEIPALGEKKNEVPPKILLTLTDDGYSITVEELTPYRPLKDSLVAS